MATSSSLPELLSAWRAAARRLERAQAAQDAEGARLEVVRAWLAYQQAASPMAEDEFLLVTDDSRRYIAASGGVERVLGYRVDQLLDMTIADLAAADLVDQVPTSWSRFLEDGSQEGEFALRATDGSIVQVTFRARVNHPVPGVHVSRLRPVRSPGLGAATGPGAVALLA